MVTPDYANQNSDRENFVILATSNLKGFNSVGIVNDKKFSSFFQSFKKIDLLCSQNYCSFSIYFVRFLSTRSFIKIVRSVRFFVQ